MLYEAKKKAKAVSIHDFTLIKILGKGSFGKVVLVERHSSSNKKKLFAMKILDKASLAQNQLQKHTQAERHIL